MNENGEMAAEQPHEPAAITVDSRQPRINALTLITLKGPFLPAGIKNQYGIILSF